MCLLNYFVNFTFSAYKNVFFKCDVYDKTPNSNAKNMIKKKSNEEYCRKNCLLFKQVTLIIIPKFRTEIVTINKITPKKENAKFCDFYKKA